MPKLEKGWMKFFIFGSVLLHILKCTNKVQCFKFLREFASCWHFLKTDAIPSMLQDAVKQS